ncbi:S24/S26 family peptidase [Thiolapillus sp.]
MITKQRNPASKLRAFTGVSFRFTIKGTCMAPVLDDGQQALVRRSFLYLPGDIIVFETHCGEMLAHRLLGYYLRRGKLHFLTQADNAPTADRGISRRQIIGKIQHPVSFSKRLFSLGRFLRYTGKWTTDRAVR